MSLSPESCRALWPELDLHELKRPAVFRKRAELNVAVRRAAGSTQSQRVRLVSAWCKEPRAMFDGSTFKPTVIYRKVLLSTFFCECKNKRVRWRYFMPVLYTCVNFIVYLDTETCKAFNLSTAAAGSRVSLVHVQPRFIESSCNCCWVWVTTKMKMFSCVSPRILSTVRSTDFGVKGEHDWWYYEENASVCLFYQKESFVHRPLLLLKAHVRVFCGLETLQPSSKASESLSEKVQDNNEKARPLRRGAERSDASSIQMKRGAFLSDY